MSEDIQENNIEESEGEEVFEEEIEVDLEDQNGEELSTNFEEDSSDGKDQEPELSDEELDDIADTAISVLRDVLKYFDVGEVTIDEYVGDDGELILDITGGDLAVLIGRHGTTLNALQFLVSSITLRKIGRRYPVVVDIEGYKSRQRQRIESIAQSAASRAAQQNKNVKLRPMSPYERRIVHIVLRDDPRVETASEGEGGTRHVVVLPKK